jgi:hypothetical protein
MDKGRQRRKNFDRLMAASFSQAACPDSDQLAAYLIGELNGNEQLVMVAHVRQCPRCRYTLEACRRPEPPQQIRLAHLLPLPLAEGQRRDGAQEYTYQYVAADMVIKLLIAPPNGDYWRLTGWIIRAGVGHAEQMVLLRTRRRRYQQYTDQHGFFTFEVLPTGRYTLSVVDGAVQVQIHDLMLGFDGDGSVERMDV